VKCILVEFVDGSFRAFDYPDEDSAQRWYDECRSEWNAGRNVVFYLRPTRFGLSSEMHDGGLVAHLELTTREVAEAQGAECLSALIFG
jgi:hypothetical protein